MAELRPMPRLLASLPCEDAAISAGVGDGRVTLQRVFFDLYASGFPAGFDRLVVCNLWSGGEGSYRVRTRIVAPDGTEVARGEAGLEARPGAATNAQLVYFYPLVLPEPGRYTVEVLLEEAAVHTYTLHLFESSAAGEEKEDGQE